ncbi:MAG TPA: DEAD/DEAH box helicase family protein, partial [Pyrinomonadaceae bacterium]|nr:DEAD/DEAH box helicase family protein [Pyrinomonadaceae bacterium]
MVENEWLTRKQRIDSKLRSLNPSWEITAYKEDLDLTKLTNHAVEEFPTENGFADYALFVQGKLIGIIEAKKVSVGAQNVLEQAKRYSKTTYHGIGNWNGFRVPFIYATNGETIWFADLQRLDYVSRQLNNFHTPNALLEMFERNAATAFSWLDNTNPSQITRLRDYQIDAIQAIENELKNDRRAMLIAMATGTGKTFFTVAQIYRLLESKLFQRILFLVDRKALAAQAVREFNSFQTPHGNKFNQEYEVFSQKFRREDFGDESPFDPKVLPESYLTNPNAAQTFVYVSTIQRMTINLFGQDKSFAQSANDPDYEADANRLDIPNNAFDLIIADECHRGYTSQETSTWRNALNHFDAVKIGLTATPAAHTVSLFGQPVFRYGVEQAIQEGYLVDYEPVKIKSNVKIDGVFLREGENIEKIDTQTGEKIFDELEDERKYESTQVEQEITVPDSNRKIIEEIARYALEHEQRTGNFPKTLIFAVNDINHTSHADQLVRICREVFGRGDDFVQKITGNANVDRPLQKIREFRNRPNPKIVVTVDMLSTGVDIPALEYIVFLRPVKSRILWEQMLGRGTRLCSDINKTHFTVFDCFDGTLFEYFKDVSNFKIEPPTKKPTPTPQIIENIYQNVERGYHTGLLIKRLRRIEKNMTGKAREEFERFIPEGDVGKLADTLATELHKNFTATMKTLRDTDFQNLMENYDRASKTFVVAIDAEDEVESEKLERYGKYDKAEDYLEAFTEFIKTNADSVSALTILLTRPQEWQPDALRELSQKLREESFKTNDLQKAHARIYHKELADLISMVKHAANEQEIL